MKKQFYLYFILCFFVFFQSFFFKKKKKQSKMVSLVQQITYTSTHKTFSIFLGAGAFINIYYRIIHQIKTKIQRVTHNCSPFNLNYTLTRMISINPLCLVLLCDVCHTRATLFSKKNEPARNHSKTTN